MTLKFEMKNSVNDIAAVKNDNDILKRCRMQLCDYFVSNITSDDEICRIKSTLHE